MIIEPDPFANKDPTMWMKAQKILFFLNSFPDLYILVKYFLNVLCLVVKTLLFRQNLGHNGEEWTAE